MAEGEGTQGAGAAELTGGEGGDGGQDDGGNVQPWLAAIEGLPDELRADPTLNRFDSPEKALRGHLEAHKLAKSKLAIPAADAPPEAWGPIWDALGRPKEAAAYDLPMTALPEEATDEEKAAAKAAFDERSAPFKQFAHKIGLPQPMAAALVDFDNNRLAAAEKAFYDEGQAQIDALKAEMGPDYEPQRAAAEATFTRLFGVDGALADEIETKVGSARLLKGMMKLAKLTGEHQRHDGGGGDLGGDVKDPQASLAELRQDAGWRDRRNKGDAQAVAQHKTLLEAAQRQAAAALGGKS